MNSERLSRGEEPVISLGIGSPDGMPPMEALEALCESAVQPGNHAYQSYVGLPELRQAFADWYAKWYGVQLDPSKEIQPLVGSKEAILLISLAFLDKGDKVLIPPFVAVRGLGETAALDTVEKRKGKEFISVEEFALCCNKLSKTHIDQLKSLGAFAGLADTSQITLF